MSCQSESRMSDRSSTCRTYEEQQNSDTEEDMYAYASPIPIAYEVPGSLSHTPPEIPERTIRPPPPRNLRMKNSDDDSYSKPLTKLYTTLTHAHVPSIYSTPSHSVEFRLNAAVIESSLDLVNLQRDSSTPLDEEKDVPRRSHSRVKMTILVFLLVAVAIGTISLVVSIVAVFVKRDTSSSDLESVSIEEMVALREEVVELQTAIEQVTNQTSGYVDFSAFYDSCITETKEESCNPELVPGVEFPCRTDTLPLNKTDYMTLDRSCYVIGGFDYPVTATFISNDDGRSVYCNCQIMERIQVDVDNAGSASGLQCVMDMLRCPRKPQTLNITINT